MRAFRPHLLLEGRVRRQRHFRSGLDDFIRGAVGRELRRIDLLAERRHFDRLRSEFHVREAEPTADDPAIAKQLLDVMRVRRRADVEVLRAPSQQQIAHAAAHEIGDVIVFVKAVQNLERVRVDVAAGDRVFGPRDDGRLHHQVRL
jgi:hypothetical protein